MIFFDSTLIYPIFAVLLWLSGTITPVSAVAVAFYGKAFLSSESGASALDARTNPMIVGPRPVTAGFAA